MTEAKGGDVEVDHSSNYWLGRVVINAPSLNLGSPGFEPRSGLSPLFIAMFLGVLNSLTSKSFTGYEKRATLGAEIAL
jgi:hypothetical protein